MACSKSKNEGAVAALPDDPLVEILTRVPAKSICRFKCVSKAWRDLIDDPDHRKKLPQAMQGLFLMVRQHGFFSFGFVNLTARSVPLDIDPAFSFLTQQPGFKNLGLLDSCNGLILFENRQWPESDTVGYVVCNPTTKRWAAVPTCGSLDLRTCAYLAFDPVISSSFHLLQFQIYQGEDDMLVSLHAYSSETGSWSHNEIDSQENQGKLVGWHHGDIISCRGPYSAFVNGFLHFLVGDLDQPQIAALDVQGKTRRMITVPGVAEEGSWYCYLGQSQGCLHYMTEELYKLSIWVLQDYNTQQWVLKDIVSSVEIFGQLTRNILDFIAGIHQECNVVFFSKPSSFNLIAYNMDHKEVSVIATLNILKRLVCFAHFVPCFSETPALTN